MTYESLRKSRKLNRMMQALMWINITVAAFNIWAQHDNGQAVFAWIGVIIAWSTGLIMTLINGLRIEQLEMTLLRDDLDRIRWTKAP